MLKALAERRNLSASDYMRQLLRREFLVEAEKWRESLSRIGRAVLLEIDDWGMPEEVGAIEAGLQEKKVKCTRKDVELAVTGLCADGLVERVAATRPKEDAKYQLTSKGRLVLKK